MSNSGKYRGLSGFPIPTPLGCIKKREHFFQDTKNWIALSTRGLTFVLYSLFYKFWHLSSSFMLSEKSEFNSFYFSWWWENFKKREENKTMFIVYSEKAKTFENETSNRIGRFFSNFCGLFRFMNFKESINFMQAWNSKSVKTSINLPSIWQYDRDGVENMVSDKRGVASVSNCWSLVFEVLIGQDLCLIKVIY